MSIVLKVEEALQSIPGCKEVMLPYWDETSEDSARNGVPWALTQEKFALAEGRVWPGKQAGNEIANPLRSGTDRVDC